MNELYDVEYEVESAELESLDNEWRKWLNFGEFLYSELKKESAGCKDISDEPSWLEQEKYLHDITPEHWSDPPIGKVYRK